MASVVYADVIDFEGGTAESEKQTLEIKSPGNWMSVVTEADGNKAVAVYAESSTSLKTPVEINYSGHADHEKYKVSWKFRYVDGARTDITLSSPNGRIGFVRTKADGGLQISSNYVAENISTITTVNSGAYYLIEGVFTPNGQSGGTAVWYLNKTEVTSYSYTVSGVLSTIYVQNKGADKQVADKSPVLYLDDISVDTIREYAVNITPSRTGGIFTDNKEICFDAEITGVADNEVFTGEATVYGENKVVLYRESFEASDEPFQIKPRWSDSENQYGDFILEVKVKPDGGDEYINKIVLFSTIFSNGVKNPNMGLCSHYVSGYQTPLEDFNKEIGLTALAGFGMNREELEWNKYELSQGEYALTNRQSELFNSLKANGVKPMSILYNGTWIYGRNEDDAAEFMPMPVNDYQRQKYAEYVENAVEDIKDSNPVFEVSNEWNLNYWNKEYKWENGETTKLTVKDHYIPMLKAAYQAVKSVDENIQVIGIAAGAGSIVDFVTECVNNGAVDYCDMISIHPYTLDSPEEQDIRKIVSRLRSILRFTKKPDMPIVFSEWGWTSAPGVLSEKQQAMYTVRGSAMVRDLTEYIIWYGAQEKDYIDDVNEQNYGMLNYRTSKNPLAAKPVFVAMSCHNSLTGDKKMIEYKISNGVHISEFQNDSEQVVQFWTTGGEKNFTFASDKSTAVLYDMYGNKAAVTSQNGVFSLSAKEEPQYLRLSDEFAVEAAKFVSENEIVDDIDEIAVGKQVNFETVLLNGTAEKKVVNIMLAVFSENGAVQQVSAETVELEAGEYYLSQNCPTVTKTEKIKSIKAYIWDKNMCPVVKSRELLSK